MGDELNDGVGEGCYYRGRLLLAINTRILAEELATGPATVSTSRIKSAVMVGGFTDRNGNLGCNCVFHVL